MEALPPTDTEPSVVGFGVGTLSLVKVGKDVDWVVLEGPEAGRAVRKRGKDGFLFTSFVSVCGERLEGPAFM